MTTQAGSFGLPIGHTEDREGVCRGLFESLRLCPGGLVGPFGASATSFLVSVFCALESLALSHLHVWKML